MFTRTVELTTKAGKARDLTTLINDKVLPILNKQTRHCLTAVLL